MKHIFIDLEFCSVYRRSSPIANETIQVGAAMLDDKLNYVDCFCEFVCPNFADKIPPKERQITGITWNMVENAPGFFDVCDSFLDWAGIKEGDTDYIIYSWSENDPLQLIKESRVKGYPLREIGIFDRWVDFQRTFMEAFGYKNQKSLEHALEICQLEFAGGNAHRADVDAYNTARLFWLMANTQTITMKNRFLIETKPDYIDNAIQINPRRENPRYARGNGKRNPPRYSKNQADAQNSKSSRNNRYKNRTR